MKHLLIIPLALALIVPGFAFGQENTGDTPVTNVAPPTSVPTGMPGIEPPKTNAPQPRTDGAPKPLPPQNMVPGTGTGAPTAMPREIRPMQGSSTNPSAPLRQFPQPGVPGALPRPSVGSTTMPFMAQPRATFAPDMKQAILERPQDFATATKAIVMERRAAFASSTAARIIEARKEHIPGFGSTTRPSLEERREHFASTSVLKKAEFTEDMKARILAHAEHAAELLDAMLTRLAGIAGRIESRIEALETAGIDVAVAQAELAEAYDAIENAGTVIEGVKAAIEEALSSETPREMMEGARAAGDAAKEALRLAHQALQEAAQALPKEPVPVPAEIINE